MAEKIQLIASLESTVEEVRGRAEEAELNGGERTRELEELKAELVRKNEQAEELFKISQKLETTIDDKNKQIEALESQADALAKLEEREKNLFHQELCFSLQSKLQKEE